MGSGLTRAHFPFSVSLKGSKRAPWCPRSPDPVARGSSLLPAQPLLWPKRTFELCVPAQGFTLPTRGWGCAPWDIWAPPCTATPSARRFSTSPFLPVQPLLPNSAPGNSRRALGTVKNKFLISCYTEKGSSLCHKDQFEPWVTRLISCQSVFGMLVLTQIPACFESCWISSSGRLFHFNYMAWESISTHHFPKLPLSKYQWLSFWGDSVRHHTVILPYRFLLRDCQTILMRLQHAQTNLFHSWSFTKYSQEIPECSKGIWFPVLNVFPLPSYNLFCMVKLAL